MKFFALALTVVGLASQLSAANTYADKYSAVDALQGNRVNVVRAFMLTEGTSEFNTTIRVYAVATFSNACMAPDELVAIDKNESSLETNLDLQLVGVNHEMRLCTMEYKPVEKAVLVRELHTDIMPIVKVNGIRATLK